MYDCLYVLLKLNNCSACDTSVAAYVALSPLNTKEAAAIAAAVSAATSDPGAVAFSFNDGLLRVPSSGLNQHL